jgi:hypothetical protein
MHASMRQFGPADRGRPLRGTFYPSQSSTGGAGFAAAIPKVLGVLLAVLVLRTVARAAGRHAHGGSSRWGRRRSAITEFHRELHAQDAGAQEAADSANDGVKA